jgi:hypothetical protein
MSSRGTRIYPVRLSEDLMEDVEMTMHQAAQHRRGPPWTLSDFIRIALREKVCKMMRSRRHRRKGRIERRADEPRRG